ncbi:hypothetical protein MASR2M18_17210 [Ignavibacteria bacterium]
MNRLFMYSVIFLYTFGLCYSKTNKDSLPFKFDSVVVIEYRSDLSSLHKNILSSDIESENVIWDNSKFNPTVTKKTKLPSLLAIELSQKLNSPNIYDKRLRTSCFFPRMGLVFYKKDSIVAYVNICLECNRLTCFPKLNNVEKNNGVLNKKGIELFNRICVYMGLLYCKSNAESFETHFELSQIDKGLLRGRSLNIPFDSPHCLLTDLTQ